MQGEGLDRRENLREDSWGSPCREPRVSQELVGFGELVRKEGAWTSLAGLQAGLWADPAAVPALLSFLLGPRIFTCWHSATFCWCWHSYKSATYSPHPPPNKQTNKLNIECIWLGQHFNLKNGSGFLGHVVYRKILRKCINNFFFQPSSGWILLCFELGEVNLNVLLLLFLKKKSCKAQHDRSSVGSSFKDLPTGILPWKTPHSFALTQFTGI